MTLKLRSFFEKVDDAVFRFERVLCLALLGTMSLAVFLDVVHRLASTEGPAERTFQRWLPGPVGDVLRWGLEAGVALGLSYLAMRTAKVKHPPTPGRALAWAVGGVGLLALGVELLLRLAPNGLLWSQTFALCGMLWVGFLGASMATHERAHLTLEIMEFVWKGKAKVHVGRVGALVAAVFCALLGYLSVLNVSFHFDTWRESDGVAGTFDPFPVPKFGVFAILPVSFALMALRFLGRVFSTQSSEPEPSLPPLAPSSEEELEASR